MLNAKLLSPCALALALIAAPAHAAFTESTSGSATTFTENFNGNSGTAFTGSVNRFFFDQNGANRDGAAAVGSFSSMTTRFSLDEAFSSFTLAFWYAGQGTATLSNSAGFVYDSGLLAYSAGTNPGLGEASNYGGGTGSLIERSFSNLTTGDYTLTFARLGSETFKIDDVSYRVTAVPEPSTIALMLAGLSIVGFAARRNKRPE